MNRAADMIWPDDVDGDVFRRIAKSDFDFESVHSIDFNIDFNDWPPSPDILSLLRRNYSNIQCFEPKETFNGYIQFVVLAKLSYELVMSVQNTVTGMAAPYGGICESWGVSLPPNKAFKPTGHKKPWPAA